MQKPPASGNSTQRYSSTAPPVDVAQSWAVEQKRRQTCAIVPSESRTGLHSVPSPTHSSCWSQSANKSKRGTQVCTESISSQLMRVGVPNTSENRSRPRQPPAIVSASAQVSVHARRPSPTSRQRPTKHCVSSRQGRPHTPGKHGGVSGVPTSSPNARKQVVAGGQYGPSAPSSHGAKQTLASVPSSEAN